VPLSCVRAEKHGAADNAVAVVRVVEVRESADETRGYGIVLGSAEPGADVAERRRTQFDNRHIAPYAATRLNEDGGPALVRAWVA
jgi:hypothetical protein